MGGAGWASQGARERAAARNLELCKCMIGRGQRVGPRQAGRTGSGADTNKNKNGAQRRRANAGESKRNTTPAPAGEGGPGVLCPRARPRWLCRPVCFCVCVCVFSCVSKGCCPPSLPLRSPAFRPGRAPPHRPSLLLPLALPLALSRFLPPCVLPLPCAPRFPAAASCRLSLLDLSSLAAPPPLRLPYHFVSSVLPLVFRSIAKSPSEFSVLR